MPEMKESTTESEEQEKLRKEIDKTISAADSEATLKTYASNMNVIERAIKRKIYDAEFMTSDSNTTPLNITPITMAELLGFLEGRKVNGLKMGTAV